MELEIKYQLETGFKKLQELTLLGAKTVLTMSDCALLTGLSKSFLYKKVMKHEIPFYKSDGGKMTYFDKSEIEAWCLKHRVKTTDEVETEAANYLVASNRKGGTR